MSTAHQIARNLITNWLAIALRTVFALVMVPFLISHLGRDGYGILGLLVILVIMAEVADLGLRAALGRELAECHAQQDERGFGELVCSAFWLYIFMALVLIGVNWFMAPWLVSSMKVPPALQPDTVLLLRGYGSTHILFTFVLPPFTAALSSINRFDTINRVEMVTDTLSSIVMLMIIPLFRNPLFAWAGIMLARQVIMIILLVIQVRIHLPFRLFHPSLFNPARLRKLFGLGGSMYAIQLTQTLSEKSDPLVVSYFFGPAGVSLYQPGGRISQLVRPVVLTLANQMFPLTTRQFVGKHVEKMRLILTHGTRFTLLIGSLFTVGMVMFAEPFCRLWLSEKLGPDYITVSYVMVGWAMADFITYAAGTQWAVLLGMKRLKFLIWTMLPTAILNMGLSVYIVGYTSMGIPGVLVATIAIGIIRRPILIWHTARCCGMKTSSYLREGYARAMICFALVLLIAGLCRFSMPLTSILHLIAASVMVTLAWAASCWLIGMTSAERAFVVAEIKKKR